MDSLKNLAVSAVATAPSPATSGTSLVVTTGHGTRFPPTPFNATVWPVDANPDPANSEIIRVTTVATDTLTITRAQEGTSARSIVVGDRIAASITKKTLLDLSLALGFGYPTSFSGTADCDFEGTLGSYTAVGASSGTVSLFETSTSVNKYDLTTMPGSLLAQVGHSIDAEFRADYTVADGESVTLAVQLGGIATASGDNCQVGLVLNDTDTGAKDGNYVALTTEQDTTTLNFQMHGSAAGGDTLSNVVSPLGGLFALIRLVRVGSAYRGMVSVGGGAWQHMGANTPAATATNVWIFVSGPSAGQTYMPIFAFPFVKVGGSGFMPW